MQSFLLLLLVALTLSLTESFIRRTSPGFQGGKPLYGFPKPIHQEFTVEKASKEKMTDLSVGTWPTWSTQGSDKYVTGKRSPLKCYDCNELSYIISGQVEITPVVEGKEGKPVLVQAGDFVTFPDGFECYWYVIETVKKNWFIY